MKRGHAVYEGLAGAILLGEATAQERREYAAHAATCAQCDPAIDTTRSFVAGVFAGAQHGETWRPFVRDEVNARIERRRSFSTRRIATILGAAVALTLGFNVALAVGFHPRSVALPNVSALFTPTGTTATTGTATRAVSIAATAQPVAALAAKAAPRRRSSARTRAAKSAVLGVSATVAPQEPATEAALPAMLVTLPLAPSDAHAGRR